MSTMTKTPKKSKKARSTKRQAKKKRIIAVYDYLGESRELLYQVVEYGPKEILTKDDAKRLFRRPNQDNPPDLDNQTDPNDPEDNRLHWIWNLDDTRRVLYSLPEILDPVNIAMNNAGKKPLFICEGEKDCESLRKIGLLATTNSAGALSWKDDYSIFLADYRSIVIPPDNDQAGKDRTEIILKSLQSLPYPGIPEIRIIDLPGLVEGGDVTDYLNGGGSKQKLLTLVKDRLPILPDLAAETEFPTDRFFATDFYNTDKFVEKYSDRMKYCRELGWLFYDRKRWNRDTGQVSAIKFAMQTARDLHALLKDAHTEEEHTAIFNHFLKSQTDRKMRAMIFLARSNDKILVPLEGLDVDLYLFNCENGTIDLRTGQFRKHRPGDMITKLAPVKYDEQARCELWLKYTDE